MTRTDPDQHAPALSSSTTGEREASTSGARGDLTRLVIYLVVTFAVSWVIIWPAVRDRPAELNNLGWRAIAVAVPSIVAIALAAADNREHRASFFRRFAVVRIAWWRALALFYGLAVALLVVLALFDPPGVAAMIAKPSTLAVLAALPLIALLAQGLGGPLEEAGWRGYALPLMLRLGTPMSASIGLGLIHATWHLPLFMITGYPSTDVDEIPFVLTMVLFFVHVLNVSILLTWVYLNSRGSIWLAVLAHAIINFTLAGQNVYDLVRDEQLSMPLGVTGTVLGAMASSVAVAALLSFSGPRQQLLQWRSLDGPSQSRL